MKKLSIIIVLMLLFLTTGCWNKIELEERAIVAGVGFDKSEESGKIDVTVQIIKPGDVKAGPSAQGSPPAVWVTTVSGESVFDAVRNFAEKTGRKLFFSKCKVYIIGENLAGEGVNLVIDWLERDPELRLRSRLIIARGTAKEVLETSPQLGKIEAFNLEDAVESTRVHGKGVNVELVDFLRTQVNETSAPVASAVEVIREKGTAKSQQKSDDEKSTRMTGTAVFNHYKLAGFLNQTETRGLLWITNQIKSGIIVIRAPNSGKRMASIEILREIKSGIKPEIKDGNLNITVSVEVYGALGEIEPGAADITSPDVFQSLEKRMTEVIEQEIRAAISRAQEMNADIFGFDQVVRREYTPQWQEIKNNWDEIFPYLNVAVEVKTSIRRTGMINNPVEPKS